MGEPVVKGRVLKAYAKFMKKKWGLDGLAACSRSIGLELTDIQDEKWYPNEYQSELLEWLRKEKGDEAVRQAGVSIVAERGILSYMARIAGFERVLDQGVQEIKDSIRQGEVSIEKEGKRATITLDGISNNEASCIAWKGVFEGALKITKTSGDVREIACQHKGGKLCVFEIDWE